MGKTFCKKTKQLNINRQENFNIVMQDLTLTEYRIWMNLWFELEDKESVNWSDTFGAKVCGIERSQYAKGIKGLVEKEYIALAENGIYCVEGIPGLSEPKVKELSEFGNYLEQVDDETLTKDAKLILTSIPFGKWMEEASIPLVEYLIAITKKTRKDFEMAIEMTTENEK